MAVPRARCTTVTYLEFVIFRATVFALVTSSECHVVLVWCDVDPEVGVYGAYDDELNTIHGLFA